MINTETHVRREVYEMAVRQLEETQRREREADARAVTNIIATRERLKLHEPDAPDVWDGNGWASYLGIETPLNA